MLDYSRFSPPLTEASGPWYRIHQTTREAVYFGRSGYNRWDSPNKEYGVMYAGETWEAAFLETVLHDPVKKTVLESELETGSMALLKPSIPLQLVDLSDGEVLRVLELTESDTKACSYETPQKISEAIHAAGWDIQGIRYASRLDPKCGCLALFDCPMEMIAVNDLGPLLAPANGGLLRFTLKKYRMQMIDDIS